MALEYAHGAIQWLTTDALNSDKVVSGLGFQPKALRFYWNGLQSATDAASQAVHGRRGVGFAVSGAQRAVGTMDTDAAGTTDCGSIAIDNGVVVTVTGAGAVDGRLSLASIDSGGFTLNVDDVAPANLTIFYDAWGGDDITDVAVGDAPEPAAIGTQSYSVPGFVAGDGSDDDKVVMVAGVQSTAAVNTGAGTDSGLSFGFSTASNNVDVTRNVGITGNSDDASTSTDTDSAGGSGSSLAMKITVGGGGTNATAILSSFDTDGFTLDWGARATTNRRNIWLAIQGGSWRVGEFTIAGNSGGATATVSGLPFQPKGINLIGCMKTENLASTAQDQISLGSASSTASRRAMGYLSENATASSAAEIDTVLEYDAVLAWPNASGALATAIDVNAINSDGFEVIVDTAGGVASQWQGYLAFGDAQEVSTPATADVPGVGITSSANSVTVSGGATVEISGASATAQIGTLVGEAQQDISVDVSGVSANGAANTVTSSGGASVTLQAATMSQAVGDFTVEVTASVTAELSGAEVSTAVGTLQAFAVTNASAEIVGVQGDLSAGTVTATAGATVTPSGVSATGAADIPTLTGSAVVSIVGAQVATSIGAATVSTADVITVQISGVEADGEAGTLTASGSATVSLTGVSSSAFVGTAVASGSARAELTGAQGTATAGTATARGGATAEISGVEADAALGEVQGIGADVTVQISGVEATSGVGELFAFIPATGLEGPQHFGEKPLEQVRRLFRSSTRVSGGGAVFVNGHAEFEEADEQAFLLFAIAMESMEKR